MLVLRRTVAARGLALARPPRRNAHFATWPPSIPARPHPPSPGEVPSTTAALYGWGDWFVASQISSVVAWPFIFATDVLFGDYLLPWAEKYSGPQGALGDVAVAVAGLSLMPKAAASYLGAHLYVPNAWWFWKLSRTRARSNRSRRCVPRHGRG